MFNELYYWMCFYAKKNKSDEIASFGALVAFSFFLFLNLTAISFFSHYFFKVIDFFKQLERVYFILIFVLITIIGNFIFLERRQIIYNKYDNLSINRRLIGKVFFWLYLIMTFAISFHLVPLLEKSNG